MTAPAFGSTLGLKLRAIRMSKRKPVAAKAPVAPPPSRQQPRPRGVPIQGIGAIIGALICFILSVVTDGKVPGGYMAGVIGGSIGWVIGIGVEKLLASEKIAEAMGRRPK